MTEPGYLLDNQRAEAGTRFAALAELFDPVTFRHLDTLGIAEGWSCWEVGAGGPSVIRGLAERVGPSGRVLATDIDTSWIGSHASGRAGVSGPGDGSGLAGGSGMSGGSGLADGSGLVGESAVEDESGLARGPGLAGGSGVDGGSGRAGGSGVGGGSGLADGSGLAGGSGVGGGSVVVLRHDVAADPPPAEQFDLVHARLVLVHVRDRARALASMLSCLRPGGWLLLEDADPALQPLLCPDESGPAEELANRLRRGFRQLLAGRGAELAYGRTLPRLLRSAGLTQLGADAYFPITSPACAVLEAATVRHIRAELINAGLATAEEVEQHLANVATGQLDLATAPMISAWGRRP